MARYTGLLGLITFLSLAYALSTDRRAIKWRTVIWGLGLQVVFAFLVIKWSYGQTILANVSGFITGLLAHSADGSSLVFGKLGDPASPMSVFAFAVLPTIIFVSAFFAILYHLGIMQQIIKVVACPGVDPPQDGYHAPRAVIGLSAHRAALRLQPRQGFRSI